MCHLQEVDINHVILSHQIARRTSICSAHCKQYGDEHLVLLCLTVDYKSGVRVLPFWQRSS